MGIRLELSLVCQDCPSVYPDMSQVPTLVPLAPAPLPPRVKAVIAKESVQLWGTLQLNGARAGITSAGRGGGFGTVLSSELFSGTTPVHIPALTGNPPWPLLLQYCSPLG